MDTSKSTETETDYIAGASIFSGRPDPTWTVSLEIVERLQSLWVSLPPLDASPPQPPALGYRGCFLRDKAKQREWVAYKGAVTLQTPSESETRRDAQREFEPLLLHSAPAGLIPPQILQSEGL